MKNAREMDVQSGQLIYEKYKSHFNTESKAKRYSTRHLTGKKSQREMTCIAKSLMEVEKNALVLDLPCGTGRLSYFIKDLGFNVLGADYSIHMLKCAKEKAPNLSSPIHFEQQDVMAISHPNGTFSATVCNRLFHHFPTADIRQRALTELARVTNGPIIVSFFNSHSLSTILSKFKNLFKAKKTDRIGIPFADFKKDIASVGLIIEAVYYTSFGLSPQTYVKLRKAIK